MTAPQTATSPRPPIVCLCGSTKFINEFDNQSLRLTLEGKIVLSVGSHYARSRQYADGKDGHKVRLDELHRRKIDLADSIFVINVHGYIGESTRREIEYAMATGKPVRYLVPLDERSRLILDINECLDHDRKVISGRDYLFSLLKRALVALERRQP